MSNKSIVIFHKGSQDYFIDCVNVNSKFNFVYVIGDEFNKNLFLSNSNVKHIIMDEFTSPNIIRFIKCFINYSTNLHNYELFCFLRIFYIYELLIRENIKDIFHLDSDCVLYEKLENITFNKNICYSLQKHAQKNNEYNMVGCVHNALLNKEFCEKFIQLCFDIYENKTKFYLIKPKIDWHKKNNISGGICDMTLYYLLYSENIIDVEDLNDIIIINGEKCTFDHNLSNSYGFNGDDTYIMKNGIKSLTKEKNKNNNEKKIYATTNDGILIRLLTIHFQDNKKKFISLM